MSEIGDVAGIATGMPSLLSGDEQQQLAHYEGIIERGLTTFIDVGNALAAVRDERLYKQYGTFEDYCHERWNMARRTAYQFIEASIVVENVRNCAQILPVNEAQARPLTRLEPEQQREVWRKAVETAPGGKVTGAHVKRTMAVHYSSASHEWYTPPEILERVMLTMGEITLDPCSNSGEQPNVAAQYHLTAKDDGLSHPWFGRVFMNPPYGREIGGWTDYLCEQFECGNVPEAVALVPARTDTEWFRRLKKYPRCFVWGRLKFSGMENSAPFPSMIVYLGRNVEKFVRAFGDIGDVYALMGAESVRVQEQAAAG